MKILGIESSCDDTSVALIKVNKNDFIVLAEKTASQIEIHKKYGGVVPEIAGRMHAEKILPVIEEVVKDQDKPDVIAVTCGPGLITGLLVGVEAAKSLSYLWNVPLVAVNHIEGHIHSVEISHEQFSISNIQYPALALIASGGHTELIWIKSKGQYKKIGATVDDAAGECFDKTAKLLNLEYPGGPKISQYAETGNNKAINFPRPMLDKNNYDFSFAGLKTSALYWLKDNKLIMLNKITSNTTKSKYLNDQKVFPTNTQENITIHDFCASFEQAIIDVLVGKTLKALKKYQPKTVILGGGVSANKKLRQTLATEINKLSPKLKFLSPSLKYAMDNATMIALVGYYKALKKEYTSWQNIKANPNWEIE